MQFKSIFTEIKADTEKNTISGYGSFFSNIDSHKDIVMPGAFKKTITENKDRIKILWQHNPYEPIGKPTVIQEDSKGLYFEAKITKTDTGTKALQLIEDKVLNELSIGYETVKSESDNKRNVRLLREVKLYEISVVTWASNELAQINGVKQFSDLLEEIKAGRAISSANREKIKNAIEALTALLEENEPQESDEEENTEVHELEQFLDKSESTRKPKKSQTIDFDPDSLQSILNEAKKYL